MWVVVRLYGYEKIDFILDIHFIYYLLKAKGTCEDYAQGGLGSSIGPFSSSAPPATLSPAAQPASPVTEGEYLLTRINHRTDHLSCSYLQYFVHAHMVSLQTII